ncbi:MAG: universal stress protein [Aminivibrio sp.]|jgi:nucleotide-binding universal stress UspA family protein|nr:universal stress protein [Synergistaceae bacterium]
MSGKILVAVDMSKMSEEVFSYGCLLSMRLQVEASFIHVLPHPTLWRGYEPWLPPEIDAEVAEIASKKLAYYLKKTKEKHPELDSTKYEMVVKEGNPSDVIMSYAKENDFNLIVIGYRGQSTIERLVVGSTAANVARYAHCSVLIYRPGIQVF